MGMGVMTINPHICCRFYVFNFFFLNAYNNTTRMTLYVATSTLNVLIFNKARFVGIILTTNPNFGIKMLSFLIIFIFIFGYMDKMFDVHNGT